MELLKRIVFLIADWILPPLHFLELICLAYLSANKGRSIFIIVPTISLIAYLTFIKHTLIKAPFKPIEEQPKWFRYIKDSIFKP